MNTKRTKQKAAGQQKLLMKITDAAYALSVSPNSVRRLINRGDLVAVRKLRHVLVTAASVNALAE
jgi:hypothetical protein